MTATASANSTAMPRVYVKTGGTERTSHTTQRQIQLERLNSEYRSEYFGNGGGVRLTPLIRPMTPGFGQKRESGHIPFRSESHKGVFVWLPQVSGRTDWIQESALINPQLIWFRSLPNGTRSPPSIPLSKVAAPAGAFGFERCGAGPLQSRQKQFYQYHWP